MPGGTPAELPGKILRNGAHAGVAWTPCHNSPLAVFWPTVWAAWMLFGIDTVGNSHSWSQTGVGVTLNGQ